MRTYRTRIIASVDKHRASFNEIDQLLAAGDILSPHAGGQSVVAVIHQRDSLLITGYLHDRHHRTKGLFSHGDH